LRNQGKRRKLRMWRKLTRHLHPMGTEPERPIQERRRFMSTTCGGSFEIVGLLL
jgi:hypothetical protein